MRSDEFRQMLMLACLKNADESIKRSGDIDMDVWREEMASQALAAAIAARKVFELAERKMRGE